MAALRSEEPSFALGVELGMEEFTADIVQHLQCGPYRAALWGLSQLTKRRQRSDSYISHYKNISENVPPYLYGSSIMAGIYPPI